VKVSIIKPETLYREPDELVLCETCYTFRGKKIYLEADSDSRRCLNEIKQFHTRLQDCFNIGIGIEHDNSSAIPKRSD
jgi:hypothetical protein